MNHLTLTYTQALRASPMASLIVQNLLMIFLRKALPIVRPRPLRDMQNHAHHYLLTTLPCHLDSPLQLIRATDEQGVTLLPSYRPPYPWGQLAAFQQADHHPVGVANQWTWTGLISGARQLPSRLLLLGLSLACLTASRPWHEEKSSGRRSLTRYVEVLKLIGIFQIPNLGEPHLYVWACVDPINRAAEEPSIVLWAMRIRGVMYTHSWLCN